MTNSEYNFKGCFIVLNNGMLIFYDKTFTDDDWRNLAKKDLGSLQNLYFENQTINELFLNGILENLKDLNTENGIYTIKFIFTPNLSQKTKNKAINLGLKFIDKDEIKKLPNHSKLKKFCSICLT